MQPALVEPLPLAEREELERVVVVRDERDLGVDRLSVDREAERLAGIAAVEQQRPQPREGVAPAAVALAAVDEATRRPRG